jgi:hypothetical protein
VVDALASGPSAEGLSHDGKPDLSPARSPVPVSVARSGSSTADWPVPDQSVEGTSPAWGASPVVDKLALAHDDAIAVAQGMVADQAGAVDPRLVCIALVAENVAVPKAIDAGVVVCDAPALHHDVVVAAAADAQPPGDGHCLRGRVAVVGHQVRIGSVPGARQGIHRARAASILRVGRCLWLAIHAHSLQEIRSSSQPLIS